MDLAAKLEKIMLEQYGITRDQIDDALEKEKEADLGIFTTPYREQEVSA
ncbi:MAG: hypothetical protein ILP16_02690 [Spirochaetales bacterium]|nr:hypothetical protein [Spirochaetales bacterium]